MRRTSESPEGHRSDHVHRTEADLIGIEMTRLSSVSVVQHHLRNPVSSLAASLAPELFRINLPRPRLFPPSRSTRTSGAEVAVGFFGIRGKRNLPLSEEPRINVRDDQR